MTDVNRYVAASDYDALNEKHQAALAELRRLEKNGAELSPLFANKPEDKWVITVCLGEAHPLDRRFGARTSM